MDCAVLGSTWAEIAESCARWNISLREMLLLTRFCVFFSHAHADYWRKKNIKAFVCFDFFSFFPLQVVWRQVIEAPLAGKSFETEAKLRRVGEA